MGRWWCQHCQGLVTPSPPLVGACRLGPGPEAVCQAPPDHALAVPRAVGVRRTLSRRAAVVKRLKPGTPIVRAGQKVGRQAESRITPVRSESKRPGLPVQLLIRVAARRGGPGARDILRADSVRAALTGIPLHATCAGCPGVSSRPFRALRAGPQSAAAASRRSRRQGAHPTTIARCEAGSEPRTARVMKVFKFSIASRFQLLLVSVSFHGPAGRLRGSDRAGHAGRRGPPTPVATANAVRRGPSGLAQWLVSGVRSACTARGRGSSKPKPLFMLNRCAAAWESGRQPAAGFLALLRLFD